MGQQHEHASEVVAEEPLLALGLGPEGRRVQPMLGHLEQAEVDQVGMAADQVVEGPQLHVIA